jgi:cyclase
VDTKFFFGSQPTTRREILRSGLTLAGTGLLTGLLPRAVSAAARSPFQGALQEAGPSAERIAKMKSEMAANPLVTTKLRENIYLLSGPGGNMVVLNGPDGKLLVDSSVSSVAPKIKAAMDSFGPAPLKILVNTHWHFDHTDGNAAMHDYGAAILAHENTRKRLSTPQDIPAFSLHFDAAPAAAWPQQTFTDATKLYLNGDELSLVHFASAHTDSDIYVRFEKSNVLHMGDVWFAGTYPFIDAGTGGNIDGMIAGSARGISLADADTKIVPGHGPVGDKAALTRTHDMLITIRDRIKALKTAGKSQQEAVAAKPTADLDATWAKGSVNGDAFTTFVYTTL